MVTMIELTLQEVRRLLAPVLTIVRDSWAFIWHWSSWRRHHQARACYFHFKRKMHSHAPYNLRL
jgi:hypothetical protein